MKERGLYNSLVESALGGTSVQYRGFIDNLITRAGVDVAFTPSIYPDVEKFARWEHSRMKVQLGVSLLPYAHRQVFDTIIGSEPDLKLLDLVYFAGGNLTLLDVEFMPLIRFRELAWQRAVLDFAGKQMLARGLASRKFRGRWRYDGDISGSYWYEFGRGIDLTRFAETGERSDFFVVGGQKRYIHSLFTRCQGLDVRH